MRERSISVVVGILGVLGAAFSFGCGPGGPDPVVGFMAGVDDLSGLDDVHEEIEFINSEEWVESYLPESSSAGYNLVLYRRRVPMLMDMQGRVVHSWPMVRAVGRMRLDREGRLTVIGTDDLLKEYDWQGRLTWAYALPKEDDMPHHDFIRLANGNLLVLAQEVSTRSDYLHEVDRAGRVVWEWWPRDHLDEHFPDRDRRYPDPTHINSLDELGDNPWFDAGDTRFRPGNILVSARNLNTIFIIDRSTGEIVWKHSQGLDYQHEAEMVLRGRLGEGLIVLFNNGTKNRFAYRRSEIRAIQPVDHSLKWSYDDPTFFTSVAGAQQLLPGGNLLISSSEGGRAFEITPAGEVVWQWIPPYLPMRVLRYPADHCPQLVVLGDPDPTPVGREERIPWVDIELGQFTFRSAYRVATLYGLVREILNEPSGCQEVLVPVDPVVQVAFGFDDAHLDETPPAASFHLTVRDLDTARVRPVLEEALDPTGETIYRDRYIAVPGIGLKRVELCVDVRVEGVEPTEELHRSVFMTNPRFYSRVRAQLTRKWKEERLSLQEQSLQERQLRAIGYVE